MATFWGNIGFASSFYIFYNYSSKYTNGINKYPSYVILKEKLIKAPLTGDYDSK